MNAYDAVALALVMFALGSLAGHCTARLRYNTRPRRRRVGTPE